MKELKEYLSNNTYPGRGVLLGSTETDIVIAYFIMGRSVNSRNRIFVETTDGIRTQAFDESKLADPSLIIYAPVRKINGITVVTNGDQTDTICEFIAKGDTFENALRTREFEPDAPNFTPRISGAVYPDGSFKMSILKSDNGDDSQCLRYFYEYEKPIVNKARLIHTYLTDGNPIPSFMGEPKVFDISGDIDTFTNDLWNSLNQDNKVSLFVRYISKIDGKETTKIINKNN